jgi:hypothetical protein
MWHPAMFLDEYAVSRQCPKMVRRGDLSCAAQAGELVGITIRENAVGWAKRSVPSLSERAGYILQVTAPISRKQSALNEPVEAAMGPVKDTAQVSVLHRIEVNVVDVTFEIGVIANSVLPISTLPDPLLAPERLASRT